MSAVTVQEIVERLSGLGNAKALELIDRIKKHGIAPPDGMEPVNETTAKKFLSCFNCEAENTTGTRIYNMDLQNVINALQMLASAPEVRS